MTRRLFSAACAAALVVASMPLTTLAARADQYSCTVNGEGAPDTVVEGTDGDDFIECDSGVAHDMTIEAGAGNDVISIPLKSLASTNYGIINAGDGNDKIVVRSLHVANYGIITGGAGDDEILADGPHTGSGVGNTGTIDGGAGADTITVIGKGKYLDSSHAGNTGVIKGADGDDTIRVEGNVWGNFPSGRIESGAGRDTITITSPLLANDGIVDGGPGADSITATSDTAAANHVRGTITGGDDNDVILVESRGGDPEADVGANMGFVEGDGGNDTVTVTAAAFKGNTGFIRGGPGDDNLTAEGGPEAADNDGNIDGGPDYDTCTPDDEGSVRNCEA